MNDAKNITSEQGAILDEILDERERQDRKWGGQDHDAQHTPNDWIAYITKHAGYAAEGVCFRQQMIRVAALAVAAIETYDRRRR